MKYPTGAQQPEPTLYSSFHPQEVNRTDENGIAELQQSAQALKSEVDRRRQVENALRESEVWLTGQKEAFQAAINGASLAKSLDILVGTAIKQMGGEARCAFYIADASAAELHHVTGMPEDYARCVDGFKIGPESLACGLAVHTGQPRITADVREDARWKPWLWLAEQYKYRGCWSFPVKTSAGKVVGTFAMYFTEPRETSSRDLELAAVLTQAAAIIISRHQEAEERARTERVLRESEQRFRAFMNATSDVIYRMSADWSEMQYLEGKDFIADTTDPSRSWLHKYIHSEDQAHVMQVIREAIRTKSTFELEHRVLRADGTVGWTFSRAIPILDTDGKILEWFGAAADVTERKQAEERSLESLARLRFVMESMPQKIFTARPDGNVDYFNQQWMEFTGLSFDQIKDWGWTQFIHPDDLQENVRVWKHSLETGEPFAFEHRFRRHDGTYRWHISRALPMRDSEGKIVMWIGSNMDVDDRKQAEMALVKSEKLAAVGRLAATMAHEINNPLEGITNLLYLAKQDQAISTRTRSHLQLADQELHRVAHVAKQTLGFCRDNAAPTWFNVSQIIDDLLAVYVYRFRNRDIKIEKKLDNSAKVLASVGEFRQLFSNLFVNAIDALPHQGGRIRIRVRTARDWGNSGRIGVRISVADTGCGIPPTQREKIFEPFFTTKQDVGTGLGLWLSRTIVQKYNGRLRVHSRIKPGQSGTVFSVFWPAESHAEAPAQGSA